MSLRKTLTALLAIACGITLFATGKFMGGKTRGELNLAYAFLMHETCTFCPTPKTGVEQFEHLFSPLSGALLNVAPKDKFPYVSGFLHATETMPDVNVEAGYIVGPAFGGSSGNIITQEAFDKYTSGMIQEFKKVEDLDGIYLALHGGMAVEGIERPESEIIKRVKDAMGHDIPIAATFDHHGNEDEALAEHLDIALAVKRFPHYDANFMGERAAHLLARTIRGTYKPTMAVRKPGVLYATVFGGTHDGAPRDVMERARRWENRERDVYVSVFQGWTFADVPDIGMAVFVLTNGDPKLAEEIAQDMNNYIWSRRNDFERKIPGVEDGVAQGLTALTNGQSPVVFANMSDRIGDSTLISHELRKFGTKNYVVAAITDPEVLEYLHQHHETGDTVSVTVGGKSSDLAGPPISLSGTLRYNRTNRIAPGFPGKKFSVIETEDGNWFVLSQFYEQVTTPTWLEDLGIPVNDLDIFVVKSRNHFRRGFMETGFAKTAITVDAPGHGPADISKLSYKNIPPNTYSKFRPGRAQQ